MVILSSSPAVFFLTTPSLSILLILNGFSPIPDSEAISPNVRGFVMYSTFLRVGGPQSFTGQIPLTTRSLRTPVRLGSLSFISDVPDTVHHHRKLGGPNPPSLYLLKL